MTDRHAIGANNPPRTVFDEIEDLYTEAQGWLDGADIENDDQAGALGLLMNMLTKTRKACDAERKEKVAPLDQAKKEIQAIYIPALERADRAIDVAKRVRDRWLKKKQAVLDEQARVAREEADRARREALAAMQASIGDLAAREEAEAIAEAARQADFKARAMAKATPQAIGGRKTVSKKYAPCLVSGAAAAGHYWQTRRADMEEFLMKLAVADVRAGKREIPGFNIVEEEI